MGDTFLEIPDMDLAARIYTPKNHYVCDSPLTGWERTVPGQNLSIGDYMRMSLRDFKSHARFFYPEVSLQFQLRLPSYHRV